LLAFKNIPMTSMGNGESKQETADFHHPVSPEILQAVIDTGGVTDGSVIPLLKDLSPLDMRITLTIHKWRPLYTARAEAHQRTGKRRLKSQKNTLLKANEVLKFWIPWLSAYDEISKELLALISKGELLRIADWLSLWPPQKGRRDEFVLVGCAEDLAQVFIRSGRRKPPWKEIGKIIAEQIPWVYVPITNWDDRGNWIYNLVTRRRAREQELKKLSKLSWFAKFPKSRKRASERR